MRLLLLISAGLILGAISTYVELPWERPPNEWHVVYSNDCERPVGDSFRPLVCK